MTAHRRNWFRFSLRTLFVVVGLSGTVGYWVVRETVARRARGAYERVAVFRASQMASTQEQCEASLQLFHAEASVPFADRHKAAIAHFKRVKRMRSQDYGPVSEWMMGIDDAKSLAWAEAKKAEIDRYYADAERMAAGTR